MSEFLERIRMLVGAGEVRISDHGYGELAEDQLTAREVITGIQAAIVVEEYPDYPKVPIRGFNAKVFEALNFAQGV